MLRNVVITGVVAVIMAGFAIIYAVFGPSQPQPQMGGQPGAGGGQAMAPSQPPMTGQPSSPSGGAMGGQPGGGTMPMGAGMGMMCPCMSMMMGQMGTGMAGSMNQPNPSAQSPTPSSAQPVTSADEAKKRANQYLASLGNPNLKVGKVNETAGTYEVQVATQGNSEVNWIIIDKETGQLRTQY